MMQQRPKLINIKLQVSSIHVRLTICNFGMKADLGDCGQWSNDDITDSGLVK